MSNGEDWKEGLPEDIRGDPSLESINDITSLAKSYIHGQKLIGHDKVPLPHEGSDQAVWDEFFKRVGRPDGADSYNLQDPDGMPEGLTLDTEIQGGYKSKAFELGLTSKQAEGLYQWYAGIMRDLYMDQERTGQIDLTKAETTLRSKWGGAYDRNMSLVTALVKRFGGDDVLKWVNESGLGADPNFLIMMGSIGEQFGEDRLVGDGTLTFAGQMSPEEAQKAINDLKLDKTFMDAYLNKDNPGHDAAVKKMFDLRQHASPEARPGGVIDVKL